MKCMLRTLPLSDALNAGAPARERYELVYFNVPPFLSAGVYQGYVLHGILIYFHIMKHQHQRVEIIKRSRKLFSLSLSIVQSLAQRSDGRQSSGPQAERGDRETIQSRDQPFRLKYSLLPEDGSPYTSPREQSVCERARGSVGVGVVSLRV